MPRSASSRPLARDAAIEHELRAADLVLVAAVAAALRIAHLLLVRADPLFRAVTGDSELYVARAHALLAGAVDPAHAFTPPLYPLFLAAVFGVAGEALELVRWLQAGCGIVAAVTTAAAAQLIAGRRAGLMAGLVIAASPVAVFFDGELLAASAVLALVGLGTWSTARALTGGGGHALFLAGASFMAAAAGQPQAAVLVAGAMPAAWSAPPRGRRIAALLGGALLVLLATGLVQWRASGHWVGLSAGAGVNFFIGNHEGANGGFDLPPGSGLVNSASGLYPAAREVAVRATRDSTLGPNQVSAYWSGRTWDWIRANSGTALLAGGKKLLLAVNRYEVPNHYPIDYFAVRSPVLALTPVRFLWVGPLGMLGIGILLARRHRGGSWLALSAGLLLAVLALFFVTDRYRLLLWPILALGVGATFEEVWISLQKRDLARILRLCAMAVVLVLVVALPGHPDFGRAQLHLILSTVLAEQGDLAGARRELETAAQLGEIPEAAHNLANAYYREGRYAEAADQYRRALELDPESPGSLFGLGLSELGLGQREAARSALSAALAQSPEDERIVRALALARGEGDSLEADRSQRRASARPIFTRALADARAGRRDSARAGFERVLRLDPEDAAAHLNLGLLAEMDGDWDSAEIHLAAAAELGASDHLELLLARGRVAARLGRRDLARSFFSRALAVAPEDPRAGAALSALAGEGP